MGYLLDDLEKTALLTDTFSNAVKENNTRSVRIMMKDSLLNDPTFKEYREMRDAAKGIKGLYDKHDGRKYNYDKNTWNDDYMNEKMVQSVNHFSPEMNQHLEDVVAHLRPEAHNTAPNPMLRNKPWPHKKMALGVGTAAAIGGGAYLYGRYKKKKRAQAEQEKTANTIRYDDKGNPMVSMYDDDSIPYIDNFEKNKRTIKRIGPGIAMAGLGVGLNDLKEKFPNSVAKKVPDKLLNGLMLGGTGLSAAGGAYNYIKERNRNKRIAAYDQEKTAAAQEEMSEKERYQAELAKFKKRDLIPQSIAVGGSMAYLGTTVRSAMGKGDTKTSKAIRNAVMPAWMIGAAGAIGLRHKLNKTNKRYAKHLKDTGKSHQVKRAPMHPMHGRYDIVVEDED